MNVTIEQAGIHDLEDILRLNKQLFEFETQFTDTYNLDWTYSPIGKEYFTKRLSQDTAICLLAKSDKEAVGYLLAFIARYPYRSVNPICEVENMFVTEQFRHQGIGRLLMDTVKTIARERGVKRLRVEAITQNEKALGFYKEAGFTEFNTILETML